MEENKICSHCGAQDREGCFADEIYFQVNLGSSDQRSQPMHRRIFMCVECMREMTNEEDWERQCLGEEEYQRLSEKAHEDSVKWFADLMARSGVIRH